LIDDPKLIFFDIECTDLRADSGVITTFAWREGVDGKTKYISIHKSPTFKKCPWDDKWLCSQIYDIMKDADYLVGHYIKRFDVKFINTRLLINNIKGKQYLPDIPVIDTCLLARSRLKLRSNGMANVAQVLKLQDKIHMGVQSFMLMRAFDKKTLKDWAKRCVGDVDTTVQMFEILRPFIKNLNFNLTRMGKDDGHVCRNCGSSHLMKDGRRVTVQGIYQKWKCLDCGTYSKGKTISRTSEGRPA
jgi:uncharacterized protein YprB with RNaseH-like and TPR domain